MADFFLGEIRIVAFPYAPKGWAQCNGQTLPISQNQALFALLGTQYGGNGTTTFALPDFRGRAPMHRSSEYPIGARGGEATHTLAMTEMPAHTHTVAASTTATGGSANPTNNVLGGGNDVYWAPPVVTPPPPPPALTALHPSTIPAAGSSQPHENMQPYLALNFCIALTGIFPSRS